MFLKLFLDTFGKIVLAELRGRRKGKPIDLLAAFLLGKLIF
jgi:hypothetical protein